jgi:hypothetical protein
MKRNIILVSGILLTHFVLTLGLLVFSANEIANVAMGSSEFSGGGKVAVVMAKVLSQPLLSISMLQPNERNTVQVYSFMLGNSLVWAVVLTVALNFAWKKAFNKTSNPAATPPVL